MPQDRATSTYFRLAKHANRQQLVSPDGHPFFSLGVNHVDCHPLKIHSPDIFKSRYRTRRKWILNGAVKDLADWGFNTIGWTQVPMDNAFHHTRRWSVDELEASGMPFVYMLPLNHIATWKVWRKGFCWPDIFSKTFENCVREALARECSRLRHSPNLMGYFYSDVPAWTMDLSFIQHGGNWVSALKELPDDAPGKRAYMRFLRQRYDSDIKRFNRVYRSHFRSFREITRQRHLFHLALNRAKETEKDDLAFLGVIAQRYYSMFHKFIRRYDPNHLILGDRYNGNVDVPKIVLQAARPYVDVASVQCYDEWAEHADIMRKIHRIMGKPVLLADSGYAVRTPEMPLPCQVQRSSDRAVGQAYAKYLRAIRHEPWIIGWHWCGYMDNLLRHPGLKTVKDQPKKDAVRLIRQANHA